MKKQKVVMITSLQPYSNYSSFLVQEYAKLKNSPELIIYASNAPENKKLTGYGKVKPLWSKGLEFFEPVLNEIQKDKPDIIHVQFEMNMYGGILTSLLFPMFLFKLKLTGAKIVVTLHAVVGKQLIDKNFVKLFRGDKSLIPPFMLKVYFSLLHFFLNKVSDRVIVHTNLLKKWLVEQYRFPEEKIQVVNMGVPTLKKSTKRKNNKKFFYFGYIARRKGLEHVLEGFSKFVKNKKFSDYKLMMSSGTIKGQEFALEEFKEKVAKYGIEENIEFLGFMSAEEIRDRFTEAYACVVPAEITISASGPLSLVFAYNKCVISSKVGNYNEEIQHKVNGYLTANTSWSRAFKEIAENPGLVKNIEKGSAEVANARSWKNVAGIHKNLYQSLLK